MAGNNQHQSLFAHYSETYAILWYLSEVMNIILY